MNPSSVDSLQNGLEHFKLNERDSIGILQHLQKDELQSLLDDDQKLEQIIQDSEGVKKLQRIKQTLIISNKSVAEYNLSQEQRLVQSRDLLAKTYGQVESLLQEVKKKKSQLESCNGSQTSLDTLLALLETEAAKTEEHSEGLSEQLLSRKMDVHKFIDEYLTTRSHMYEQKVKADKLFEIMYQQI